MEESGYTFKSTTDSEIIANLIASAPGKNLIDKIKHTMGRLQGAYSLVIMTRDRLLGVRDPMGVRPLCLGSLNGNGSWVLASESCALDHLGAAFTREIKPGEIVMIDSAGVHSYKGGKPAKRSLCIFEYIYFARPDSLINGRRIYQARWAMGEQLAREYPRAADLVIGVPDSATAAGIGYSLASGIPFWATLATGLPFTVVHVISNVFIFGIVTLTLEKAVRRHLATVLWQVQDAEEPSAKNKKTVQLEHM